MEFWGKEKKHQKKDNHHNLKTQKTSYVFKGSGLDMMKHTASKLQSFHTDLFIKSLTSMSRDPR